jgi:hypothetical protein
MSIQADEVADVLPPTQPHVTSLSLRAYANKSLHYVLHEPIKLGSLVFRILCSPSLTAKQLVSDNPGSLLRAGRFYTKLFAITFLISSLLASQYWLYEGRSETRELGVLVIELIIGTAVLFVLSRTLSARPSLSALVQSVLYVDAVFLLVFALTNIPVSYLNFALTVPSGQRELDIFETVHEVCVARHSFLYWLVRGDTQWYLHHGDLWKPGGVSLGAITNYLVAVPFLFTFAVMITAKCQPKRQIISIFALVAFGAIAFAVARESVHYVKNKALSFLVRSTIECDTDVYADEVLASYSSSLIVRQALYIINNNVQKHYPVLPPLYRFT